VVVVVLEGAVVLGVSVAPPTPDVAGDAGPAGGDDAAVTGSTCELGSSVAALEVVGVVPLEIGEAVPVEVFGEALVVVVPVVPVSEPKASAEVSQTLAFCRSTPPVER
jgi:hypothetical protein